MQTAKRRTAEPARFGILSPATGNLKPAISAALEPLFSRVFLSLVGLGILGGMLPAAAADWTVGVYMAADNDLSDQAYRNLAEMMAVGSTPKVNIVVQVDRPARDSNPGCRRLYVRQGGYDLLADLGPVNMADTATLAGFARFLALRYPARNYFLVLWDHGDGWYEGYRSQAIFIDESHGRMMGVAGGELGAALESVRQALGRRIRVLAFDACLMGMVEVAAEARGAADYMLAAEGLVPWCGLPYDKLLELLVAEPGAAPVEFLPRMCAAGVRAWPGDDVSLAATDLRQLDAVFRALGRVLPGLDPKDPRLAEARARVQTYPTVPGRLPSASDGHVDFLHFWALVPDAAGPDLTRALGRLAVARAARGRFADGLGLAGWFPAARLEFKRRVESYLGLAWSDSTPWPRFLNAWYGRDDTRPTRPEILGHRIGSRGEVRLWWRPGFDLAPVGHELYEAVGPGVLLADDCENFDNWEADGWTAVRSGYRSPPGAFFSGTGRNLDHRLTLAGPLALPGGGFLSLWAWYDTAEEEESRNPCHIEWCEGPTGRWQPLDSLYGSSAGWRELRYFLPPGAGIRLRFRYLTGEGARRFGVYIDDIRVNGFERSRRVAAGLEDTAFTLRNLPRNTYHYFVTATDTWGNVSMVSELYPVTVEQLAEPVTRPAPFSGPCQLWFDPPPGSRADVRVYTVSGALVREFRDQPGPYLDWDGRNAHSRELADGLYLVVVSGEGFRTTGRVAKVAR